MGTITANALALSYSSLPHLLRVNGVYYAFYFDNTDKYIKYSVSIDGGLSWSAPANASREGNTGGNSVGWAAFWDGTYIVIAYWYATGSKYQSRRGTPTIPIVWDNPVDIVASNNTGSLDICQTTSYLWVVATANGSQIYVYKSGDHGNSWTNSLTTPGGDTDWYPLIASLESDGVDHLMLVYEKSGASVYYYQTFNGSAWSGESTVGEKDNSAQIALSGRDLWPVNGVVYFVYVTNSGGSALHLRRWANGAWSNPYDTVDGNTDFQPTICNCADRLRIFYRRYTSPTAIYYREMPFDTQVWSDEKTLIGSRPTSLGTVSSEKSVASIINTCLVTWRENASAPYSFLCAVLQIGQFGTGAGPKNTHQHPRQIYQYNRPVPREALQAMVEFFKLQTEKEMPT